MDPFLIVDPFSIKITSTPTTESGGTHASPPELLYICILAIFYPFSQFCEMNISHLSLQTQPNTAPNLFQRGVEYGKYDMGTGGMKAATFGWRTLVTADASLRGRTALRSDPIRWTIMLIMIWTPGPRILLWEDGKNCEEAVVRLTIICMCV